jgi:hypothetical protein
LLVLAENNLKLIRFKLWFRFLIIFFLLRTRTEYRMAAARILRIMRRGLSRERGAVR